MIQFSLAVTSVKHSLDACSDLFLRYDGGDGSYDNDDGGGDDDVDDGNYGNESGGGDQVLIMVVMMVTMEMKVVVVTGC